MGEGLIRIINSQSWVEVGEELICIVLSLILDDQPLPLPWLGGAHLHHPQYISQYLEWKWGWGSFASPMYVSLSTLNGDGGGAHLHHPQYISLYLEWKWRRGSFASPTVYLSWMEMGGTHLHQPQCTLYLPLSWVEAREELLISSVVCFPYLLGESGIGTHLAVSNRWTGLLEWTTGMDYWNGLWPFFFFFFFPKSQLYTLRNLFSLT